MLSLKKELNILGTTFPPFSELRSLMLDCCSRSLGRIHGSFQKSGNAQTENPQNVHVFQLGLFFSKMNRLLPFKKRAVVFSQTSSFKVELPRHGALLQAFWERIHKVVIFVRRSVKKGTFAAHF